MFVSFGVFHAVSGCRAARVGAIKGRPEKRAMEKSRRDKSPAGTTGPPLTGRIPEKILPSPEPFFPVTDNCCNYHK